MAVYRRRHLNDLRELLGVEAGAPNQAAVAQRQLDVGFDVARVDAASVEHTHLSRRAGADELSHRLPDHPHRLVCVLRVSALSGTDGPHRLVRDDQARGIVSRTVCESGPYLAGHDLRRPPIDVMLIELADAHA